MQHGIIYLLVTALLIALVGYCETKGLLHADHSWKAGLFVPSQAVWSFVFFNLSIATYILYVWSVNALGVKSPSLHILIWLVGITIMVALLTGEVFAWPLREKIVAVIIVAGIAWLMTHVNQ